MDDLKDNATQNLLLAPAVEPPRLCDPTQQTRTHIDDLANEILAYIFLINVSRPDISSLHRAATTVATSQVCTRWREVALNYPTIWGLIIDYDCDSLKWIDELLRRSSPSPLDFRSRMDRPNVLVRQDNRLEILEMVLKCLPRIRIFDLQTPAFCWEFLRSRLFQQRAPNLALMSLCMHANNDGRVYTGPLFDNHAPNLRALHLHRCAVDFTSPTLKLLTMLYVERITELTAAPTVIAWLHILSEMPSLRWIGLSDAISDAATATTLPIVHLPHLDKLSAVGEFHESIALVKQLITPPHCSLKLRLNHAVLGLDQHILHSILGKKLDFWEKDSPNRRFVAKLDEDSIFIGNSDSKIWEVPKVVPDAEEFNHGQALPLDPPLIISLRSLNSDDATSLFLSLFGLFERTFLNTAFLTLWIDYRAANATEVFQPLIDYCHSFVNLETLGLANDSHSFLLPLLQHVPSPGSVLLPHLHTLFFAAALFRPNSGSLGPVAAFIQWRKGQGYPIRMVDIYESRIDRNFVRSQLRDVEVIDYGNDTDPDTDEEDGNG